jgi:hypothetical protein
MSDDRDMLFGMEGDEDPFDWGEGGDEETFDDLDDFGIDLGDEDEDAPDFGEPYESETTGETPTLFGLNRTFVLIGGVVGVVLCIGIIALVLLITANAGPNDVELTVTAVYATNTFVAYALELTETQNANFAAETATAEAWTDTPTPTATFTATSTPSPTEEPTQQAIFVTPSPEEGVGGGLDASVIELTATALAGILQGGTPTPEEGIPGGEGEGGQDGGVGGFVTPTPAIATALPNTGLFDEGFANGGGVNGLLTAGLAALGLAAIILVSRRLRAN